MNQDDLDQIEGLLFDVLRKFFHCVDCDEQICNWRSWYWASKNHRLKRCGQCSRERQQKRIERVRGEGSE